MMVIVKVRELGGCWREMVNWLVLEDESPNAGKEGVWLVEEQWFDAEERGGWLVEKEQLEAEEGGGW